MNAPSLAASHHKEDTALPTGQSNISCVRPSLSLCSVAASKRCRRCFFRFCTASTTSASRTCQCRPSAVTTSESQLPFSFPAAPQALRRPLWMLSLPKGWTASRREPEASRRMTRHPPLLAFEKPHANSALFLPPAVPSCLLERVRLSAFHVSSMRSVRAVLTCHAPSFLPPRRPPRSPSSSSVPPSLVLDPLQALSLGLRL